MPKHLEVFFDSCNTDFLYSIWVEFFFFVLVFSIPFEKTYYLNFESLFIKVRCHIISRSNDILETFRAAVLSKEFEV